MDQKEYIDAFEEAEKEKAELDSVLTRALDRALDTRKFEIELYWKRAAYFWAFLAVTLAGYFTLRAANIDDRAKGEAQLILSCLGVVFSLTWYFVNRASKFWQENWEHHVSLLEGRVIGPLYETVLGDRDIRLLKVSGPYPFSVSKLNQILSLFVLVLFLLLAAATLKRNYYCCSGPLNLMATAMVSLTVIAVVVLFLAGGTWWWTRRPEERVNRVEAHRVTTKLPDPPAEPPTGDKTK